MKYDSGNVAVISVCVAFIVGCAAVGHKNSIDAAKQRVGTDDATRPGLVTR